MSCIAPHKCHGRKLRKLVHELKVYRGKVDKHFLREILGPSDTWFHATDEDAEWDWIATKFKEGKLYIHAKFFFQTFGSVVFPPLGLFFLLRCALSRNPIREQGLEYKDRNDASNEDWWFVNGMSVNSNMIKTNGKQIASMFHRKVDLFYNPTQGLLFDFFECASGLVGHMNLITRRFGLALIKHLKNNNNRKMILMVHSQGCIIAAAAMRFLWQKGETDGLRRLEIYTFGSPQIEWITFVDPATYTRVPYYEHYANERDLVAKIGILRILEENEERSGQIFTSDVCGHFFGEHYLSSFLRHKYTHNGDEKDSKLYEYLAREQQQQLVPSPE